jgi:hypothetical protein
MDVAEGDAEETRHRKRRPPCGVLHRAEAAFELLRGTHFVFGRSARWPCVTWKASWGNPRSGGRVVSDCSNASSDELQGCERIAQPSRNRLHSMQRSCGCPVDTMCVGDHIVLRSNATNQRGQPRRCGPRAVHLFRPVGNRATRPSKPRSE